MILSPASSNIHKTDSDWIDVGSDCELWKQHPSSAFHEAPQIDEPCYSRAITSSGPNAKAVWLGSLRGTSPAVDSGTSAWTGGNSKYTYHMPQRNTSISTGYQPHLTNATYIRAPVSVSPQLHSDTQQDRMIPHAESICRLPVSQAYNLYLSPRSRIADWNIKANMAMSTADLSDLKQEASTQQDRHAHLYYQGISQSHLSAQQPNIDLRHEEPVSRRQEDKLLISYRKLGVPYTQIAIRIEELLGIKVHTSTLRGRYRALTKPRSQRVRKPTWTPKDVSKTSPLLRKE